MTQQTAFGEASIVTLMKVKKAATGKTHYYRVKDGNTVEIDAETYFREGGQ